VFDADPATPEKMTHPIFGPFLLRPNGWTDQKMPLGTEVNLDPGDVLLDVVTAAPLKGAQPPPVFGSCLL